MKKKSRNKTVLGIIVLAGLVLFWQGAQPTCAEGDQYVTCLEQSVIKYSCVSDKWKSEKVKDCELGEFCRDGICLDKECSGVEQQIICKNPYEVLMRNCVDGHFEDVEFFCLDDEYCLEGEGCEPSPETCGDGICQEETETPFICYEDCGSLGSWDIYHFESKKAFTTEEYEDLTKCTDIFDCDTPEIEEMSNRIMEEYDVRTPLDYMKAVGEEVHSLLSYTAGGGFLLCGESATDILEHQELGYGFNCIDFSVLEISLLRQKNLITQQQFGCVGPAWHCRTFSFILLPMVRLGRMPVEGEEIGVPTGAHSYVTIWSHPFGWSRSDPTMGYSLSKSCVNYLDLGVSSEEAVCYLTNPAEILQCQNLWAR